MAFLRRLGWYLVGLSVGIVFLVFFLKKKSGENGIEFCYLPNCRVLKDMREKPMVFDDALPLTYRDTLLIRSFLVDGDVDFGKSDTKSEPYKTYYIDKELEKIEYQIEVRNYSDKIVIKNVEID